MSTTTHKRRWYQFSLRTLLGVMLFMIVTFGGWVQLRRQQSRDHRERMAPVHEAVAAIEELGGYVGSEYKERRPQTWLEKQFDDPGPADDPVGILEVTVVELDYCGATDDDLKHVKVLTTLKRLQVHFLVHSENLTDAGLMHLEGLTNLKTLWLHNTNVTDEGAAKLQQALPNCWIVH